MQLRLSVLLLFAALLLVDVGTVAGARKSKLKSKSSKLSKSSADWQALLRAGEGRRAADILLARGGISGGVAALHRERTEEAVSRVMGATTDEWELYSLGAVLIREYSGDQGCVKAGLELLARVAAQGGQASTPADELSVGTKYRL